VASLEAFRAAQRRQPWRPYDALTPTDSTSRAVADRVISDGWQFEAYPRVSLRPPLDWTNVCSADRSWAFSLHCWDGLGSVLTAYEQTRGNRYLDFALDVATDWARMFTSSSGDLKPAAHAGPERFEWYDMAVGIRAYRLAYLLDVVARDPSYPDDVVATLFKMLRQHAVALADDTQFKAHNNHGFFQAVGQLAMTRRLLLISGMPEGNCQATERVRRLIDSQFTDEGVHREHSPGYHELVMTTLERTLETGLLDDPSLLRLSERIENALAWFVLPDGSLAQIGDTDPALASSRPIGKLRSEHLKFVLSRGREGRAPPETLKAFPDSGYVVFRAPRASGPEALRSCSYLLHTCAFHSRTHKHADDLSFIWYDRGTELLSDSGRYGYLDPLERGSAARRLGFTYGHPHRMYVESTRAHNTIEIDGRPHARRHPYGSALTRWGQAADIMFAESVAPHRRSILHSRVLVLRPHEWLLIFDNVTDFADRKHDFRQWLQFGPDLEVCEVNEAVEIALPQRSSRLYLLPLLDAELVRPVRGQVSPELLGWASREYRKLTPIWTCAYLARSVPSHVFATLVTFGHDQPRAEGGVNHSDTSGRRARLAWNQDGVHHAIELDRSFDELEVSHSETSAPDTSMAR